MPVVPPVTRATFPANVWDMGNSGVRGEMSNSA
jgi:hypothetical protein